jgi:hypothetical protein
MQTRFLIATALLCCAMGSMAYVIFPFSGWPWLKAKSRDIIVARCNATPEIEPVGPDGVALNLRGLIKSDIQILSVLKGTTNSGTAQLLSKYWPRQRDCYLIFANYSDGVYQATEEYRIIPLGLNFSTNLIAGKPLDEQIRAVLRYRLDMLGRQIEQAQEEKKRLEEGLKQ